MSRANGDTARPASVYADDHYESPRPQRRGGQTYALYTLREYSEFAPFARVEVDGVTVRIETDGNGRLVEYVEQTRTHCYGVPRSRLYAEERPQNQNQPKNGYDIKRAERRRRRMTYIVRWLKEQPNKTKRDIARRYGISASAAWHDLNQLRQQGKVIDTPRRNDKGRQTSLWNAT